MRRPMDCLATAVAAVLNLDELDLPWTGGEDWDAAVADLRRFLRSRGWLLVWSTDDDDTSITVADVLEHWRSIAVPGDENIVTMISCSHPSMGGDRHVLVARGSEVVCDPSPTTSPIAELKYHGVIHLMPVDAGRFTLSEAS